MSIGISLVAAISVTFSVAVVAMEAADFTWSPHEKGVILSALFYGFIVTQIPGGLLVRVVPANIVFGIGVLGACVFTWFTPLVATNFLALVTFKVIEGLFMGVTFPSMISLMNNWAPPLERSRMILIAVAGNYFGPVISMPLAGILCDHFGWKCVFIFVGISGVIWFIPFIYFVRECPEKDKCISETEVHHILKSIETYQGHHVTCVRTDKQQAIPWFKILTSIPFWGIIIANFTLSWGAHTLATQMPTYLNDVNPELRMSLTGFFSMFPALMTGLLNPVAGYLADLAQESKFLTTLQVRQIFTCVAFVSQCGFMLLSALLITNLYASITLLSVGEGLAAFALCGFGVNYLDIAPQYSGVLLGISNTIGTLAGVISPLITGTIVKTQTDTEWQIVFVITASIYFVGAIVYWFTASGELQDWAQEKNETEEAKIMNTTTSIE